jgi:protein-disulfide isomerase
LIVKQYVNSGKIRYALLDLPLSTHKLAFKAAEASHCAKEQGKFWEMHDRMFANQNALDQLNSHAESINLNVTQFENCLNANKYADEIRQDIAEASKLGITGTPSFVIATTDSGNASKVKGISLIRGMQQFAAIQFAIDQAIAKVLPK